MSLANNTLKGIQLGDDDAPITVIEYRSLTCSHCAEFSKVTLPELKEKYIDKYYLEIIDYINDFIITLEKIN